MRELPGVFLIRALTPFLRVQSSWVEPSICSFSHVQIFASSPGFSVHGIFQARILECVVISFSRVSFQLKDPIHISCLTGGLFTTEPPGKFFIFGDMEKTLKIHPLSKFLVLVIKNLILLY